MANDCLDPLSDDIADLLDAERRGPGIPDVARARLSRRIAQLERSSFAISEDAAAAARADATRRHSTRMLIAVAGIALVFGIGSGMGGVALTNKASSRPAITANVETTPHHTPATLSEPAAPTQMPMPATATAPPAPATATAPPAPATATAPPAPATAEVAATPPPSPSKKRSATPAEKARAATADAAPSPPPAMTPPLVPTPAKDEPSPSVAEEEQASLAIPSAVNVLKLSKPPATTLSTPQPSRTAELYLELARDAVRSNDATTAIALVKAHKKKFGTRRDSEERDSLWIRALIIKRHYASARDRIERFERRYPRSTYLPTLRKQLSKLNERRRRMQRVLRTDPLR